MMICIGVGISTPLNLFWDRQQAVSFSRWGKPCQTAAGDDYILTSPLKHGRLKVVHGNRSTGCYELMWMTAMQSSSTCRKWCTVAYDHCEAYMSDKLEAASHDHLRSKHIRKLVSQSLPCRSRTNCSTPPLHTQACTSTTTKMLS